MSTWDIELGPEVEEDRRTLWGKLEGVLDIKFVEVGYATSEKKQWVLFIDAAGTGRVDAGIVRLAKFLKTPSKAN